jgi:hypothetical protein
VKKISILTLLAFASAIVAVSPAYADGVGVHVKGDLSEGPSNDTDRTPDHRQVFLTGESFVLKLDKSSVFDGDASGDQDSDSNHSVHNTAEWVWWLKDKDKKKFDKDPGPSNPDPVASVTAPEPASLFLLGSGVLALGAWRRRTNSAPTS